jgi:hypothetical protein
MMHSFERLIPPAPEDAAVDGDDGDDGDDDNGTDADVLEL